MAAVGIGRAIAEETAVEAVEVGLRHQPRGSTAPVTASQSVDAPAARPSNSSGVPSATISPAERMTTRSASASISSR